MKFEISKRPGLDSVDATIDGDTSEAAAEEYVRANKLEGGTYYLREIPEPVSVEVQKTVTIKARKA